MTTTVVNKRMAPFDVYIGRPSPWGNPFAIGPDGDRNQVCDKFEALHRGDEAFKRRVREQLRGRRLGCFCKPLRCHGDCLARVADE